MIARDPSCPSRPIQLFAFIDKLVAPRLRLHCQLLHMRHEAAAHRLSAIVKSMADTQRAAGSWINSAMLALSTHGWSTEAKSRLRQRSRGDESLHVDAVLLLQSLDESLDEIRKVQYDMLVWCNAGAFPINIPDVAAQPTCADAMDEAIGLLNVFDIHLARWKSKTDDCVLFDVHLGFLTDVMAILHPHVKDSKSSWAILVHTCIFCKVRCVLVVHIVQLQCVVAAIVIYIVNSY